MVSDNNIDKQSAKYWCIFADKDLKSHLDKAKKFGLREGKNLKAALVKAELEVERLERERAKSKRMAQGAHWTATHSWGTS